MKNVGIIILSLALSSCSLFQSAPNYTILEADGVYASNSPLLFSNIELKGLRKTKKGVLHIKYPILVQNSVTNSPVVIDLTKSQFVVNQSSIPIHCTNGSNDEKNLNLNAGDKKRVLCKIELRPDEKNQLSQRDSRGLISLPVMSKKVSYLQFPVIIRIEEFQ